MKSKDRAEQLNTITHLIGATAALAGTVVLVVFASLKGDPWKIVSFSVYGVCLFLLYLFSSLYHAQTGSNKSFFHKLDLISIYLLIAGTYTPFTLVTLRGVWGWSLFGIVWMLAVFGIMLDVLSKGGRRILPVVIYVLMGWICVTAIKPLFDILSFEGFMWLLSGGVFYTFGILFYALDKISPYYHTVWHLFVLAGSTTHYITIFVYVL